jgi:thiol:disulfide interchange protein
MNKIFANTDVGKKNMVFGLALFLMLGVGMGIPLTIDLFGGSVLTPDQYQTWKVVHGYGVFLAFINYFFGLFIDRLSLPRQQKEMASWAFLLAGLIGGVGRMILVFLSALDVLGIYASLVESALFFLGTLIVVRGQLLAQNNPPSEQIAQARYSHAK